MRTTAATPEASELLTTAQAAERLGLAEKTLEAWRWRGGGPPFVRLSARAVRYRPEDLQTWVAERVRTSTSDTGREGRGDASR